MLLVLPKERETKMGKTEAKSLYFASTPTPLLRAITEENINFLSVSASKVFLLTLNYCNGSKYVTNRVDVTSGQDPGRISSLSPTSTPNIQRLCRHSRCSLCRHSRYSLCRHYGYSLCRHYGCSLCWRSRYRL